MSPFCPHAVAGQKSSSGFESGGVITDQAGERSKLEKERQKLSGKSVNPSGTQGQRKGGYLLGLSAVPLSFLNKEY